MKICYSISSENETLQYLENFSDRSAYIARDRKDIYYRDSSFSEKVYISHLITIISDTKKRKFRSESVKTELLSYYYKVLALLRHYRIEFMLNPRPIMSELDQLALAC